MKIAVDAAATISESPSDSWLSKVQRRAQAVAQPSKDSDADKFCKAVLPSVGHYRIQYRRPGQKSPNQTVWVEHREDVARHVAELDAGAAADVYVSMATFRSASRGDRDSVLLKRGFYVDIDCGQAKPYPDKRMAATALKDFCLKNQLPISAIVVDSGYGLHAHWPVDRDLEPVEWYDAAQNLRRICELHGLRSDASVTADVARILRVPGTHNSKDPSNLRPVRLIRYSPAHNAEALLASLERSARLGKPSMSAVSSDLSAGILLTAQTSWFEDQPEESQIHELRKMLIALPNQAADERDSWIQTLAQIASAKSIAWDDRVDLAWEFSRRSAKSEGENRESVARHMQTLGERTNINALRNRAIEYGYRNVEHLCSDRRTAERELTDRYVHVASEDLYFNVEKGVAVKKSAVKEQESWRMPMRVEGGGHYDPCSILRDSPHTRRCDGFGFHPGAGPVFQEDGRLLTNQFRPYKPEPVKPTRSEQRLLITFLRHLFPRLQDLRWLNHLLNTYAFLVQNPGERVKFAMILVGAAEGSGKSTLIEEIPRLLFGRGNVVTISTHGLESSFTDYLSKAWIGVFAEISLGTAREAARMANALKDNQTNEQLRLIEKNRPGRTQRNRISFFGTSNDENHAMHLSEFDRRSAIFATPARTMDERLSTGLYGFLKSTRAPGVLRYPAISRKIVGFNPSAAPPMTDSKRKMIAASRHPARAELVGAFEEQLEPFNRDLVLLPEVRECLRHRGIDVKNLSDKRLGEYLKDLPIGARRMPHQRRITVHGEVVRIRPWIVRNAEVWEAAADKLISEHLLSGRLGLTEPSDASRDTQAVGQVPQAAPAHQSDCSPASSAEPQMQAGTP